MMAAAGCAILQYIVQFYNALCNFKMHFKIYNMLCNSKTDCAILQYAVQFQNELCNFTICCRLCKTCVRFARSDLAICLVFNKQCSIVQCNETNLLCVKSCFMCMVLLVIVLKEDGGLITLPCSKLCNYQRPMCNV